MPTKQKRPQSSKSPPGIQFQLDKATTQEQMIDNGEINRSYPVSTKPTPSKFKSLQRDTFTSSERATINSIFDILWPSISKKKYKLEL